MLSSLLLTTLLSLLPLSLSQVTATFPNGATNPAAPTFAAVGSTVNQTSMSRLVTLNGVDDFCMFGPPVAGAANTVGNTEPIVVAWCTKPRNGARLIPDGAITSAKFIRTPLYVQISGFWDGTKVNIPAGDTGGELDPHGAENLGNPIGGNVTSNVPTGGDVFYEEWMMFVSSDQFCLRICTAQSGSVTAALQCEHELDIMGCNFVMALGPDQYSSQNTFVSCAGEPAAPPGLYPQANGSTSTFRQRYTGTYTDGAGAIQSFTVGQTITPSAPAFIPATSNCLSYSTIANGINTANFQVTASPTPIAGGASTSLPVSSLATSAASSGASSAASSGASSRASSSGASSGASSATSAAATGASTSRASSAMTKQEGGMGGLLVAGVVGVVGVVVGVMEVML